MCRTLPFILYVASMVLSVKKNYHDVMTHHPENFRWQQWSLEEVAALLFHRFPDSHIWIIKASRIYLHKFSCYDNFVQSNLFGTPEHSPDCRAFKHLHALLTNAFKQAHSILHSQTNPGESAHGSFAVAQAESFSTLSETTNGFAAKSDQNTTSMECSHPGRERDSENLKCTDPSLKFILIGFSKGCVVLNQLLYALSEAKKDEELAAFINNIKEMYWLDGGHAGGSKTWVTSPEILKGFAQTGIPVHAHVTPYQVQDDMRAWIGKEHKKFIRLLRKYGAEVTNQLHFENETPSVDNHFRVLQVFKDALDP
ncbi:mitochondrial protein C2orf69 homolog isoform X2 [Heptranchias perlo]|uniref:mitochondrial protein C2orf69 homolog isoform X2 n=1 Tax=Heptranchias perlo TaxID=212740 RepID=UPI00355AAAAF